MSNIDSDDTRESVFRQGFGHTALLSSFGGGFQRVNSGLHRIALAVGCLSNDLNSPYHRVPLRVVIIHGKLKPKVADYGPGVVTLGA